MSTDPLRNIAHGEEADAIGWRDAEIESLRAEVKALRKDAQRYDYLRSRKRDSVLYERYAAAGVWCDCENEDGDLTLLTGNDLDAAVDAAMEKEKP